MPAHNHRVESIGELKRRLFSDNVYADSSLLRDIDRLNDNDLSESEKLNSIIKQAEARSPRLSLFNEFLSCNVLSQVINTKTFPKYKKGIIAIAAEEILNNEFEIIQKMCFNYDDGLRPASLEEICIDLGKTRPALIDGYYFLKHKKTGKSLIYGIDFVNGFQSGYIAMYSNEDTSDISSTIMKDILAWAKTNNFLKGKKIDSNGRFIKTDDTKLEDVIIDKETKSRIVSGTVDMFNNVDKYKQNNLPIKRGILMEGEPGTGKTLIAKALCNCIDSTFIWVTADDIKYPEDVSYVYDMARELVPTLILFEDIDYIGKTRATYDGSFDKVTGELLNQMDGVESNEGIITLASSNYPKALDKALRNRPGRFDVRVRFELPNADIRKEMLHKFFSGIDITDIDIDKIVESIDGYTGAYIKELVTATIMLAIAGDSVDSNGSAIVKKSHISEAFQELEKSRKLDDIESET